MKKKTAKKKTVLQTEAAALLDIVAYNRSEKEKKPSEIEVEKLYLDPKNPRLADTAHTGTQPSILKVMVKDFDLQPLIDSMYQNGFFWEEPLVAVQEPVAELNGKKGLVVIEGNRRLAALKTIHQHPELYSDDA